MALGQLLILPTPAATLPAATVLAASTTPAALPFPRTALVALAATSTAIAASCRTSAVWRG